MKHSIQTVAALAVLGGFMLPAQSADKVCKLEIAGTDLMQYDKKELKVAGDCTQVQLTLKHTGKLPVQAMGHNWVLASAADVSAVANAGMSAGLDKHYVPAGDKRVIAHTKVIGGGQATSVTFPTAALKKGQAYTYVCTFPGHSALMKGTFSFG
jgi:azurin